MPENRGSPPRGRLTFVELPDALTRATPSANGEHRDTVQDELLGGLEESLDETTRHERPGLRRVRTDAPVTLRLQSRYRESTPIGKGGMSTVHRVTDAVVGRRVAVKMFKVGGPVTREDEQRFIEEARITGQLEHPNIVPIHDLCVENEDQPPYFTMKLVEGRTLTEIIRENAQVSLTATHLEPLLEVFLRVCDAIAYAHTRGVIHRDLKPENIMVGSHGQVYVMDWGVARLLPHAAANPSPAPEGGVVLGVPSLRDERGSIIGTMIYMAPEQAMGLTDEVDERTDVFGLGAMLYAILTARPPYLGRTHIEVLRLAREAQIIPPDVVAPHRSPPPELCRIAMKAMSCAPGDRYARVDAMRAEVAAFVRGGGWFPTRTFAAGEVIVQEGDSGDEAFILVEGECEVVKQERGISRAVKRLRAGDVFGEAGVFSARPRTASVVACTPVVVKLVTKEALRRELEGRDWLRAFFEALADRFVSLDAELTRIRTQAPPEN